MSYQCSSPVLSSWAGRRKSLTLGDRCHVPNTALDRLAESHRSWRRPIPPSTRTPLAHTHRARHIEGLYSPLQTEGGGELEWVRGERKGVVVLLVGEDHLIIIISSPSVKAVFFASHPGVNHPNCNPCICSTTLHFIGHLELKLSKELKWCVCVFVCVRVVYATPCTCV